MKTFATITEHFELIVRVVMAEIFIQFIVGTLLSSRLDLQEKYVIELVLYIPEVQA